MKNMPIQIYWKFHHQNENFQIKNSDIFHISAQNLDCGYLLELPQWGSSNKYPQSMFLSRNKKNNVYPCKPQFYYTKVGFKGGQHYIGMFLWCRENILSGASLEPELVTTFCICFLQLLHSWNFGFSLD